MKVSKVVLVVVALHVLVIGGIFVFEGCSRAKTPGTQIAQDESQPGTTTPAPAPVADNNLTPATPTPAPAPAPSAVTTTPAPAPAAAKTYVVKKGDSLYKIAKAEKITVEQLAKANNLSKTSKLQIDQKLNIPAAIAKADAAPASAPTTTVSAPAPSAPSSTAAGNVYEVKSGDSLWKIARSNNTTVAALKQANNLTKDSLKVGQKLVMPAKAAATATVTTAALTTDASAQTYIVAANDTIASIAKTHGVKVEDLLKLNKMTATSRVRIGDKLLIPSSVPTATAPASAGPAVIAPGLVTN